MTMQKRKITVIVDNCLVPLNSGNLNSVNLVFSPPNTTSQIQPSDCGIIRAFKVHYHRLMLQHLICSLDASLEFQSNLLLTLHFSQKTLSNCYRQCGFTEHTPTDDISNGGEDKFGNILDRL